MFLELIELILLIKYKFPYYVGCDGSVFFLSICFSADTTILLIKLSKIFRLKITQIISCPVFAIGCLESIRISRMNLLSGFF